MPVTPEYKINLARQMRRTPTPSEARLWTAVRGNKIDGAGFRRQRPIGRYVADFVCEADRVVVEVDGAYHLSPEQRELDCEREAHFTGRGYRVLRVTAEEVMGDLNAVADRIRMVLSLARAAAPTPGPSPVPGEGSLKPLPSFLTQPSPVAQDSRANRLPSPGTGEGPGVGAAVQVEEKIEVRR